MLAGKTIVVTGAAGNLGSAVCARLLRGGARVFALVHREGEVVSLASALVGAAPDAAERLAVHPTELAAEASVDAAYAAAVQRFGPLWGAAHVAGSWAGGKVAETSLETFEKMIAVNLRSTFLCSRAAIRHGAQRIANVAAYNPAVLTGVAGSSAYAAAKAGVIALTKAIAEEGVRANCVAPGTMQTPQNAAAMSKADPSKWVPLEDVAEAIAYLLGPQAPGGAVLTFPAR